MLKKLILSLALLGFFGAVTLPSYTAAQTTTEDTKTKKAKTTKKKKEENADTKSDDQKTKTTTTKKKAPTAKQLAARKKFADCAHSWGDHKKATGEKTRKQYNAYMSKCLKKEN
jgi:hypothetical protein